MRVRAAWAALVSFFFILSLYGLGIGQAPMREDPEKILSFAHYLLSKGQFYRAEGEYLAFLSLFPHHPLASEAWFYLGITRKEQKLWEGALEAFLKVQEIGNEPFSGEATIEIGNTLLLAGHPRKAAAFLERAAKERGNSPLGSRALIMASRAWIVAMEYEKALALLNLVKPGDPTFSEASDLRQQIEEGMKRLPKKDPIVASILSALFPGMGHLYAGRPVEAITSLALNGAFLIGALYSTKEGCLVSAGILSLVELGWYLGGIESAMDSARKFNQKAEESWLRELGLPSSGEERGGNSNSLTLSLKWRF